MRRLTNLRHRGHWKEEAYILGREAEEEEGTEGVETTAVAAASMDEEEADVDAAAAASEDDAAALELDSFVRLVLDLTSVAGGEGVDCFCNCSVFCFLLAGMTSVEMDVEYILFVCSSVIAVRFFFFFSLFACCCVSATTSIGVTEGAAASPPEQRKSSSSSDTMTGVGD